MTRIQVLGTGCPNCERLAENARATLDALGSEDPVDKVTEITEILGFGVLSMPALAVDGEIVVSGRVPGVEELRELLAPVLSRSD